MDTDANMETAARNRFDALQYSFFAGPDDGSVDLEGGLEDDVDVPPREDSLDAEFISCLDNLTDDWGVPRSSSGASVQTNGDHSWPTPDRETPIPPPYATPPHELNQMLSVTELESQLRAQTLASQPPPPPWNAARDPNGALTVSQLEAQLLGQIQIQEGPIHGLPPPSNGQIPQGIPQATFPPPPFPDPGPPMNRMPEMPPNPNFDMHANFDMHGNVDMQPFNQHQRMGGGSTSPSPHNFELPPPGCFPPPPFHPDLAGPGPPPNAMYPGPPLPRDPSMAFMNQGGGLPMPPVAQRVPQHYPRMHGLDQEGVQQSQGVFQPQPPMPDELSGGRPILDGQPGGGGAPPDNWFSQPYGRMGVGPGQGLGPAGPGPGPGPGPRGGGGPGGNFGRGGFAGVQLGLGNRGNPYVHPGHQRHHHYHVPGTLQFKCMSLGEIGRILSLQAQNILFSNPYFDDYYYQAFMKKHGSGLNRFAPSMLRPGDLHVKQGKAVVRFADLEGLGKIPFSNLRTPRPLIDFGDDQSDRTEDNGSDVLSVKSKNVKPLHMEQMLHARKVIEDCMCLLLDVNDIDRILEEDFGKVDIADLARRRAELVHGLVGAFRVFHPGSKGTGRGSMEEPTSNSDGVFLRLMSLVKGRTMLSKLLKTLVPPPLLRNVPPPDVATSEPSLNVACCRICFMILRNIRALFGPTTWIAKQGIELHQASLTKATITIASGLVDVISTLESAKDVSTCFEMLAKGDMMSSDGRVMTPEDLLLPFLPPEHNPSEPCPPWLESVLVALMLKSKEVGLENNPKVLERLGSVDVAKRWQWAFAGLYRAVTAHLQVLVQVQRAALERNQPEALEYARGLLGKELLTATLTVCDRRQRNEVKNIVGQLTER